MSTVSLALNRVTSGGVPDIIVTPDEAPDEALPAVIALNGSGQYAPVFFTGSGIGQRPIIEAISAEKYTVVIPSIYSYWGNASADTAITSAIAVARANGAHPTKRVVLIGGSMGGGTALKYAADHPDRVLCIVGLITAIDWDAILVSDAVSQRAVINTAWGRSSGDTSSLPAGTNPYTLRTGVLAQVAQQHWVATDDLISENYATYQAATGCDMRTVGALGHTEAAVAAASIPEIIRFITSHQEGPYGTVAAATVSATMTAPLGGLTAAISATVSTPSSGVTDSFNRADSASTLGNTDTGQTWTATAGTWGISTNRAYLASGATGSALVEASVSDCTVKATMAGSTGTGGLAFRYAALDINNGYQFWGNYFGLCWIVKVVSGGIDSFPWNNGTPAAVGDIIEIVLSGTSITVKKNGTQVGSSFTDSFNQTATKHGVVSIDPGGMVDDFSVV